MKGFPESYKYTKELFHYCYHLQHERLLAGADDDNEHTERGSKNVTCFCTPLLFPDIVFVPSNLKPCRPSSERLFFLRK